jgi:hypothetical protein
LIIHPYKIGSRGAKRLREAMNTQAGRKVAWVLQRAPKGSASSLIVNWGGQQMLYPEGRHWVINPPSEVQVMSDKIKFFERVGHDKQFLSWTTDRSEASEWGVKSKVFVRHLTRGSGGRGIDVWVAGSGTVIPAAPLYTRHQAKTHEFRVHLHRSLNGSEFLPLLIQRKVWKDVGVQPKTWDVRSHDNGFIFQTYPEDVVAEKVPQAVLQVVSRAMAKYFPKMHFAALDVLYHKPTDTAVICEGNTAPGVENDTVNRYAHYLRGLEEEFRREKKVYV